MADHPTLSAQLRTPAPTLEPDDILLARLSALAAAGAPAPASAAAPRVNWRVGLAAASVAAVVVGAAWLGGLGGTDTQNDPAPADTPTAPAPSRGTTDSPSTTHSPSTSITSLPGGLPAGPGSVLDPGTGTSDDQPPPQHSSGADGSGGPATPEGSPGQGDDDQGNDQGDSHGNDQGDSHGSDQGDDQGNGQGDDHPGQGQGPDEHAGNHPDEHASAHPSPAAGGQADDQTTADRDQAAGSQPGDGAGGRQPR
ncbi:MAG TPA: hypothetical protein VGE14_10550 [Marmoricola sp.]